MTTKKSKQTREAVIREIGVIVIQVPDAICFQGVCARAQWELDEASKITNVFPTQRVRIDRSQRSPDGECFLTVIIPDRKGMKWGNYIKRLKKLAFPVPFKHSPEWGSGPVGEYGSMAEYISALEGAAGGTP